MPRKRGSAAAGISDFQGIGGRTEKERVAAEKGGEVEMNRIVRVFPRKTAASPTDALAFFGAPTIENIADCIKAGVEAVHISTTFTWDIPSSAYRPDT